MKLLKRLLKTAGPLNGILAASILVGLVATGCQFGLLAAGFTALFKALPALWLWVLILALVGGISRFGEQYLGHLAAFKILSQLRNQTYQKIMRLAPAKLDEEHSSDVLKLLAQDIDQIEIFYAHTLAPVVIGLLTGLGFTVLFWLIQPLLGVIALVAYVLIGLVLPNLTQRQFKVLNTALSRTDLQEQRLMAETVTGKLELQQYQAVDAQLAKLQQTSQYFWRLDRQKAARQTQSAIAMQLTLILALAAFITVAALAHVSLVWAVVFPFTFSRLLALGNLPGSLTGGLLAAQHVFDLLDEAPRVAVTGRAPLPTLQTFGLTAVDFAYPKRPTDQILTKTELTVRPGERVGLIGASGAGKSTIMKLVMRWYDADHGTVRLNNLSAPTYDLDRLRARIAYVPQVAQIFNGSIRENLTLRDATISDDQLWTVLSWLDLTPTIRGFKDQLDTVITSSRPILSAGEVQRLELARALARSSDLLILDEPTSNLDVLNEALILKTVKQHYHGTVVLVTHRHSSLALCDRVLELKRGRLIAH